MHPRVVNVRAPGARWDVYVGRGRCPVTGRGQRYGNPYPVRVHGKRAMILFLDMLARRERARGLQDARDELRGQVLGCWCAPRTCHGEVWARLADGEDLAAIRADVLERLGLVDDTGPTSPQANPPARTSGASSRAGGPAAGGRQPEPLEQLCLFAAPEPAPGPAARCPG
ncbi:MAG: DUF4326 domain-containing protein [Planctomycetes bacterium]|nr:DUF4326 domain-containing protein [Planctomycetota bacterium]